MRKRKYSPDKMAKIFADRSPELSVRKVAELHGISESTYYRWKRDYSNINDCGDQLVKQKVELKSQQKSIALLSLDKAMLLDILQGLQIKPGQKRVLVDYLRKTYMVSERRACKLLQLSRTSYRYLGKKPK
ncbi:MAG: transposase [Candidatus Marinimicrobia bacterium]|nr:transposase [Candidatus Neomarinimicrobiota bacterium]